MDDQFKTIECIGSDGLIHFCEPHKATATCGVIVIRKKLGKVDMKRFNCPKCGY